MTARTQTDEDLRQQLAALTSRIVSPDAAAMAAARDRQANLTKPPGSLGRLESLSIQIAGIMGVSRPQIQHKVITVMAGDHGVVEEGISAYPQSVTAQMVANFLHGGAAINVLAHHVGARVVVVDMGVAGELPVHPRLVDKKIANGTQNLAQVPAMSRRQALQALLAGAEVIEAELAQGLDILGTGDMGIGNTTPSAAIAAAMTNRRAEEIVGRGTGVNDTGLARKIAAVDRALSINRPDGQNALDVLTKVGGFEIGGLAGALLAAAAHRRPVVIDGFISTAAAMIAAGLAPAVRPYLIAAHHSVEKGHGIMLEWLGLQPLLALDMRLGEGTGAALGISLAEAACHILNRMATFDEAGVSDRDNQT